MSVSRSGKRQDFDDEAGGYCAADGSVKYASDAASRAETDTVPGPRVELAEPPPAHSSAVKSLTAKYTKPKVVTPRSTDDSDSRTAARKPSPDLSAGVTSSGDSVYVSAALLKGRGSQNEDVELASASAQVGKQSEVQVGMARVGIQISRHTRASLETFTARAAAGIHNPDGSTGLNVSAGGHIAALKFGFEDGVRLFSVSAGLGAGIGVSSGTKVVDGETAYCASAPIGPVTVNVCTPPGTGLPDEQQVDSPENGTEGAGSR